MRSAGAWEYRRQAFPLTSTIVERVQQGEECTDSKDVGVLLEDRHLEWRLSGRWRLRLYNVNHDLQDGRMWIPLIRLARPFLPFFSRK